MSRFVLNINNIKQLNDGFKLFCNVDISKIFCVVQILHIDFSWGHAKTNLIHQKSDRCLIYKLAVWGKEKHCRIITFCDVFTSKKVGLWFIYSFGLGAGNLQTLMPMSTEHTRWIFARAHSARPLKMTTRAIRYT